MMAESIECRSVQRCYDQLISGIQDPSSLADTLFARGLISDAVTEEVHQVSLSRGDKCRKLLSAVRSKLAIESDAFEVFVAILKEEPTLAILSDRLMESYSYLMETSCQSPSGHRHISTAVAQFAAYLHEIYQCRTLPVSKRQSTPGKHYINLAVICKKDIKSKELDEFTLQTVHGKVDDITKNKKPIELQQIGRHENGSFARCVLVEGAPGVGKTTLAWELCRRWKEILEEFDIVLLLTLRDKSIQEAKTLPELFYHPNEEVQKKVAHEITGVNSPSVLLILEGYDEMPLHIQSDSIFSKIIEGTGLPSASVLITTRPSSSRIVHEKCHNQMFQHIEVVGFTSADIDNYIHDVMGQDEVSMNKFYEYLECHPHIRTMMSNPLNCGLTIQCYQFYEGSDVALKTQTELYSNLTKMLIVGELSSLEGYSISTLSDLPEDIHQKLVDLSQYAYSGIVKNTLVFQKFPQSMDPLGLVQKSKDARALGIFSYNFIHLTLQEFLAAYHISLLPPSKQAECIDTHIHQDHMQVVLHFLAGLTKFKVSTSSRANTGGFLESIRSVFGRTPMKRLKSYIQSQETKIFIESVHWLLEIQDKETVQSTVSQQTHKHTLSGHTLSPFNCYALSYCVENSECQWKLELRSCSISNEAAKALCHGSLQNVETLDLSRNKAHELGVFLSSSLRNNHILTELRLEGCGMNEEGTVKLTSVLQCIPSLSVLDLSLNGIGAEAATNLGRCCSTVSQLYLVGCCIGDQQISEMAPGLRHSTALRELWLKVNPIGEQGASVLADTIRYSTTLALLSLLGCGSINTRGATALVQSVLCNSSLKRLQLSETFKAACEQVQDYSSIAHRLDWCTDFTQQSVVKIKKKNVDCEVLGHALRGNTALTDLKLVNCGIDGSDIIHLGVALSDIHTLEVLDLHRNHSIASNGTKELALLLKEHAEVTELNLRNCNISSRGVSNLRQCLRNITKLNLGYNGIGNSGAKELAQALADNTTLTHLDLKHCDIGGDGMVHLSPSFKNKTLQHLYLHGNKFGSKGAEYLAQALAENTTLTHLDLNWCGICADGMAHLSPSFKNKPLQQLNLHGNEFGSKGAEHLAQALVENTTFTHLDLNLCDIGVDGMAYLSPSFKNKPLQHLHLNGNKFGSKGVEYLAHALVDNTTLTYLDMNCCDIGVDGMAHLSPSFKNKPLQHLDLHGNKFGSKGAEYLTQALTENTVFTYLDINWCDIDVDGMAHLSPSFKNKPLQHLNIYGNKFGSKGVEYLAQALTENTTLTHLDLNWCDIGVDGMAHLSSSIKNKLLQHLCLHGNKFGSKGAEYLAQALAENTTLTHLDLNWCDISVDGMAHLSPSIKNKPLQHLYLHGNIFSSKGAEYLAQALAENTTLTHLDLNCCDIGVNGMAHLSPSFKNKPLQHLDLHGNKFSSENLAQALTENTTLTHLDLSWCDIGVDGMAQLLPSFKYMPLQYLHLNGNKFGSKGVEFIAEALKGSTTLTELQLSYCDIDDREKAHLRETLRNVNIN